MKKIILCLIILNLFRHHATAQLQGKGKTDSLFTVLQTAKDNAKVNTLNMLASEFRATNPDTALYLANEALSLATKLNYRPGIADAHLRKGAPLINLGKYEEALKEYDRALESYDQLLNSEKGPDKLNFLRQKGTAYNNMGIIHINQSNFPGALKNYFAALNIFKELGDKEKIAATYNNIGIVYDDQGNFTEALKNHFISLKISEEINNKPYIADTYLNIGSVNSHQNNYPEALKYYSAALKINTEIGNITGIANSYHNSGVIYYTQGDYTEAFKNYVLALNIYEELGNKINMVSSYNNIGNIYEIQGNYPESLKYHFASLKISEEIESKQNMAISYAGIGNIYTKQKKYRDAAKYLNKSLSLAKEISSLKDIARGYESLATLDSAQSNFKQAYEHYKLFTIYHDSLFNEDNTKYLVRSQMQYDFDKKESLAKAEQEKKDAIAQKELQKQTLIRNGFVGGFAVVLLFAGVFFTQRNNISKGKKRSDELLLNILPAEVAEELKQKGSADARQFDDVTVMFTDFKDFTRISEKLSPTELVFEIHTCFKAFDNIVTKHDIEKIKTIGDSYMCAGGLPVTNKTNALDVVNAAMEIQQFMRQHLQQRKIEGKEPFEIRIGVHTGPVVAGIVGVKKFAYDIWGDTVNIASRMESSGEAGKVNISGATYELIKNKYNCLYRGKINAKNKGEIDMYFVEDI